MPRHHACRSRVWNTIAALLIVTLAACSPREPGPVQRDRYLVGAYYYLWFPKHFKQGHLRAALDPPQLPALGRYASADPAVAEQHIAWATSAGVDFFAIDWWPSTSYENPALDQGFLKARNIGDIRFCLFYETWRLGYNPPTGSTIFDANAARRLRDDLLALAGRYFNHPSYLRVAGRPVLILYLTRTFAGEHAAAVRDARQALRERGWDVFLVGDEVFWRVTPAEPGPPKPLVTEPQPGRFLAFDAITGYNMYEGEMTQHRGYGAASRFVQDVAATYEQYLRAGSNRVYFVPGVIPGYNDRGVRPRVDHFVIPRQWDAESGEGSFFARSLERLALPYVDPRLNMMMVNSWNEWNEDTAIEPLASAAPTRKDQGHPPGTFTQDYRYEGHGTRYLEVLRDHVVAIAGRVEGGGGAGARIDAWQGGRRVASEVTRSDGSFRLSRLVVSPGACDVAVAGGPRLRVAVDPEMTTTGVVLRSGGG